MRAPSPASGTDSGQLFEFDKQKDRPGSQLQHRLLWATGAQRRYDHRSIRKEGAGQRPPCTVEEHLPQRPYLSANAIDKRRSMTVAELSNSSQMHPPRLSRLDQIFPNFSIYFVTCNTHQRTALLANTAVHEAFRAFCRTAQERHVWVGRYVVMPDHLHFFVDCGNDALLGDWMKSLKNSRSKILRQRGHESPHWQKGFFDHLVRSEPSYEQKWQYTRENPVRAKLVENADQWPYQGECGSLPFT